MESVDDSVGTLPVFEHDLGDNVRPGRYDDALENFTSDGCHCALNVCCCCAGCEILCLDGGRSCDTADRQASACFWEHIELGVQVGRRSRVAEQGAKLGIPTGLGVLVIERRWGKGARVVDTMEIVGPV